MVQKDKYMNSWVTKGNVESGKDWKAFVMKLNVPHPCLICLCVRCFIGVSFKTFMLLTVIKHLLT